MARTTFTDHVTIITADWLNGVDSLVNGVFAGVTTTSGARTAISAAKSGANSDITSLTGLTTAIPISEGGTGETTQTTALTALLGSSQVPIVNGGTGATTAAAALTALGALPVAGGTMTGDLTLKGNPTTALMAAPKQYVDAAGRILQSVAAQSSAYVSTTVTMPASISLPTNTQGTQALTCAITPKSSGSKLHVQAKIPVFVLVTSTVGCAALFRDTTADAIAASFSVTNGSLILDAIVDSTGVTETTFKLRYGPSSSGTMYLNGNASQALFSGAMFITMRVDEIAA